MRNHSPSDFIAIVFSWQNIIIDKMFTIDRKLIYCFISTCVLIVISGGLVYLIENKIGLEDKYIPKPEETYTWYYTHDVGFVSSAEFPQLKPAPEGYLWFFSEEYGLAFLYPEKASVNFCSDYIFCEKFGISPGGIIINTTPSSEIVLGEKTGWDSVKRDLYGLDIKVSPYSIDNSPTDIEQTIADVKSNYYDYYGVEPVIFTEQNRGTYEADYTKLLLPVYFVSKNGAFSIGSFANDILKSEDEEFCINESQEDCLMPIQSHDNYIKVREYINTIIQSFTVIE